MILNNKMTCKWTWKTLKMTYFSEFVLSQTLTK
jgi:hypothetical protein